MNEQVKAKWLKALRSGEYKQIREGLSDGVGYCCLGVLCDLYRSETGKGGWSENGGFFDEVDSDTQHLTTAVKLWADLASQDPAIFDFTISCYNDGLGDLPAHDFLEIADLIEENL